MKELRSKLSLFSFITFFTLATSCTDTNIVSPSINSTEPIKPRSGVTTTTTQWSTYANSSFITEFVDAYNDELANLSTDIIAIGQSSVEVVVLERMNEWLEDHSYDEYEDLPSFFYTEGECANIPNIPSEILHIFQDVEDILDTYTSDSESPYDEFKTYIEGINMGSVSSTNRVKVANALWAMDIFLNYSDEIEIYSYNWKNFMRCTISTVGSAVVGSMAGGPVIGIITGFVAWSQTDACFEI